MFFKVALSPHACGIRFVVPVNLALAAQGRRQRVLLCGLVLDLHNFCVHHNDTTT